MINQNHRFTGLMPMTDSEKVEMRRTIAELRNECHFLEQSSHMARVRGFWNGFFVGSLVATVAIVVGLAIA